MLALYRCGKNRPHALFFFDAMLLTAAEQLLSLLYRVFLIDLAEYCFRILCVNTYNNVSLVLCVCFSTSYEVVHREQLVFTRCTITLHWHTQLAYIQITRLYR